MNRSVAELIAVGGGSSRESIRSGHVGLGREMSAFANPTSGRVPLGAAADGEVVTIVKATGRSAVGSFQIAKQGASRRPDSAVRLGAPPRKPAALGWRGQDAPRLAESEEPA